MLLVLLVLALFSVPVQAATRTFNGAVSGDIEVGGNYSGGVVPADDTTTDVLEIAPSPVNQPVLTRSRSVAGLSFASGAGSNRTLTSSGGPFTLTLGAGGVNSAITSGTVIIGSAASASNVHLALSTSSTFATTAGALQILGVISGGPAATLTKTLSGNLTLSSANTFSGGLTITGGRVNTNASNAAGSGAITLAPDSSISIGAASDAPTAVTLPNDIVLNAGGSSTRDIFAVSGKTLTLRGVISGSAPLSINDNGAGTLVLAGASTYSGATAIKRGTLALGASNRIADASDLVLSGGTFSTGGFNESLGALSATSASSISFGAANSAASSTLRLASYAASAGTVTVRNYSSNDRLFVGAASTDPSAGLGGAKGDGTTNGNESKIQFLDPEELGVDTFGADQLSSGEVVPIAPPRAVSGALISEFRFHGASGPADEFVEIANVTGAPLNVSGWSIQYNTASGLATDTLSPTSPATAVIIPPRGRLLFFGTGYKAGALDAYAQGDWAMSGDARDNSGVALRNQLSPPATVDAVGFASSPAGFKQGNGLPAAPTEDGEYSFVRDNSLLRLKNTGENAEEFLFVSTSAGAFATASGPGTLPSMLGAPGPESTSSPLQPLSGLVVGLLAGTDPAAVPNRERRGTSGSASTNDLYGTLVLRRRLTNRTGRPISQVRFRAVRITTKNSPAYVAGTLGTQADVRLLDSQDESVLFNSATFNVKGTLLETPPAQNAGGGANSSVIDGTLTLGSPLANGATRDYAFRLGVMAKGAFSVVLSVEAVPGS